MKRYFTKKKIIIFSILLFLVSCVVVPINETYAKSEDNKYYIGETQKKDDEGYGKNTDIGSNDVHYGWRLGQFCVSGFTRNTIDETGNIVFLKNVGDKISLSFNLECDIDKLNDNEDLHVSEDTNGYDEYFNIPKSERTNFGRGTLLIKKTDYQNKVTYLNPYTNYLNGVEKGANTEVQLLEEGDYEIALDYELQKNNFHFGDWRPFDSYSRYQILVKFSVRNGNCMVYPFDVMTKDELVNTSFTKNGFYIDMANSRYLNIDVKKQNYVESEGKLVEDVRFNKPASDGEEFTDEGIYVITVHNLYTDAITEKKIYVGSDPLLKAYVTTGKDLDYIKELLSAGATIEEDGTILLDEKNIVTNAEDEDKINADNEEIIQDTFNVEKILMIAIPGIAAVVVIIVIIVVLRKKVGRKNENKVDDENK